MGYKMSEAFPSKYLRAADLHGRSARVVIQTIEMESVDQGKPPKPVLYFQGKEKGAVLNKTNAINLSSVFGDDSDSWIGATVELFNMKVQFQGNLVDSIRMRAIGNGSGRPQQQAAHAQPLQPTYGQAAQAQAPQAYRDELDQDIPF